MAIEVPVPPELNGVRADKAVALIAGVSRGVARRWFDDGQVTVDGAPMPPSRTLTAGQVVRHPEPPAPYELEPDPTVPFEVLYEDDVVAVVDKPAGVVVHPGAGRVEATLAAGLLARWPGLVGVGQEGRWGLVHRLDRETSGALIVALTSPAYNKLTRALADRDITRLYLAGVQGRLAAETGTVDAPIRRDPQRPTRMTVHRAGRPARTHYRVVDSLGAGDQLLEVTLETGRTHQIRVHLSRIGHPVLGDRLYGWRGSGWDERIWLHARLVSFDHPETRERLTVEAPTPAELAATITSPTG